MKKSKNILLNLPEETQAWLADLLLSNVPYHKAMEILARDIEHPGCPVVFSSLSVFRPFWEAVCAPAQMARWGRAAKLSKEFADHANATPGKFTEATIKALEQKAFELAVSPGCDPDAVKAVFSLVLKARDQDLDAEKLKLDWEKFTFVAAKAAMEHAQKIKTIASDAGLGTEEKIAKVVELVFGKKPGTGT